ncbi:MAG TPA: serine/threonine-protein kinase [Myxococcota bacterium]|nr:serine/threonine-protein kinase [Myxococcota bacterium]
MTGEAPPSTLGRYTIRRHLRSGGMAELYLAMASGPAGFEREVVLKCVHPKHAANPAFVSMLIDEARIVARLRHGNIVPLYDFGQVDGRYFLAMEYVHGVDLARVLRRAELTGRPFPRAFALWVGAEACRGLEHAHSAKDGEGRPLGVVHRDVTPSNILLTYEGDVRILDFGIAKAEQRLTETTLDVVKGKVQYMSPEQASADDVDGRADLFSLGVVMFEMLSGRRPAGDANAGALLERIVHKDMPGLAEAVPGIDPAVAAVVDQALLRDRTKRWQGAGDLADALSALLHAQDPAFSPRRLAAYLQSEFPERADVAGRLVSQLAGLGFLGPEPSQPGAGTPPRTPAGESSGQGTPAAPAGPWGVRFTPTAPDRMPGGAWGVAPDEWSTPASSAPSSAAALASASASASASVSASASAAAAAPSAAASPAAAALAAASAARGDASPSLQLTASRAAGEVSRDDWLEMGAQPRRPRRWWIAAVAAAAAALVAGGVVATWGAGDDEGGARGAIPHRGGSSTGAPPPAAPLPGEGAGRTTTLAGMTVEPVEEAPEATAAAPAARTAATTAAPRPAVRLGSTPVTAKPVRPLKAHAPGGAVLAAATSGAPPPPATASAASGRGKLLVRVHPWAQVYVDGKLMGTAPMPAFEVPAGPHDVRLVNPALGRDETRAVTVAAGDTTSVTASW